MGERDREGDREPRSRLACEQCGSDTYEDVVAAVLWRDGGPVAVEGIPARICERCGEQYFDEETARRIEDLLAHPPRAAAREILVPVFSLADVDVPGRGSRAEARVEEEGEAIESILTGSEGGWRGGEGREAPTCGHCASETRPDVVRSAFWAKGEPVVVQDIPARVCGECGEPYYDDESARRIAELAERGFPAEMARRRISVPLFSLAEAPGREGDPRTPAR